MNSHYRTTGQDRNLVRAPITFKDGILSKSIFRFWRVVVSGWLLDGKLSSVLSQSQNLKSAVLDPWPDQAQAQENENFKNRTKVLEAQPMWHVSSRERPPGFQESRNLCREIRQNTAGVASWNPLCFIHASSPDGWFPGGGSISQGSDVTGNK